MNRGAGAFVCGEGSALTSSIEGKRGMPRVKPPRTIEHGLWGKPTVLNNVETFANVPLIIRNGVDWYRHIGTEKSPGTKAFALTGNVVNTGLIEVPMGTTVREVIFDIGGGIPDGKKFKAVQIGGPSGGCCCASMLEILDRIVSNEGTMEDLELLENLSNTITETALCGLGQSACKPVQSTLRYFRDEYLAHVVDHHCPICNGRKRHLEIIPELCKGCGKCAKNCPMDAISGQIRMPHVIDTTKCIHCGACWGACPFGAIDAIEEEV